MRYYVTYELHPTEVDEDIVWRNKLLGRSHWHKMSEHIDDEGTASVTVVVDEGLATFIGLKKKVTETRPSTSI